MRYQGRYVNGSIRNRLKKCGFTFLFLLCMVPVFSQGIKWRNITLDQAKQIAEKEKKLVFVDCYTDWCKPCKRMMKEVFSQPVVGRWFNSQFVNIRLNMEYGWGKPVKDQYDVRFYPTFLFIDAKGEVVHRFTGYQEQKVFLFESEKSLLRGMNLRDMKAEYNAGLREPEFLEKYFEARALAYDFDYDQVRDYLNGLSDEDLNLRVNMRMVFKYAIFRQEDYLDFDGKAYRHLVTNEDRYKRYFDEESVEYRIAYIVLKKIGESLRSGDRTEFERAAGALRRWEEQPVLQNRNEAGEVVGSIQTFAMSLPLRMTFFLQEGDIGEFEKSELQYLEKIRHRPMQLNQLARMYYDWFDDEMHLTKAELWCRAAIELDSRKPDFYTTLAFIQYKKGEIDNARSSLESGIALAKRLDMDHEEEMKLLSEIKQIQEIRRETSSN